MSTFRPPSLRYGATSTLTNMEKGQTLKAKVMRSYAVQRHAAFRFLVRYFAVNLDAVPFNDR